MNTRFEIEPGYADALRAAGLADFDALFNATPSGPPTSKHRHRETVPIEFDVNGKPQRFFLKRVFKVPGQHSWRPWLRGKPGYSQPVREWDNIKMMREAGLPVMKRVAVGERRKFGIPTQAFILVEDVGMQWTLENWLIPGFPKPPGAEKVDKVRLWYEIGLIRRAMNNAKLHWLDVHPKHIFADPREARQVDEPRWRFALVDLERVAPLDFRKFIDWVSFGENLDDPRSEPVELPVIMEIKLTARNTRHDDWNSFFTALSPYQKSPREYDACSNAMFAKPIDAERCSRMKAKPYPPHDQLMHAIPLPDSYVHPRAAGLRWEAGIKANDTDRETLRRIGIHDVESAFALSDARSLNKPGLQPHRDRLRIETRDDKGKPLVVFIKRYRQPPLREQIRRMVEGDRTHSIAYREYQTARHLMEYGIPSIRMLAVGEEMSGWWERRSFVVAAAAEGESLESLARKWHDYPQTRLDFKKRWNLIARVAQVKHRLSISNLFHRDLYLSHLFLTENADGEFVVQLIDVARMIRDPNRHRRWNVKDLAALAYSLPPGLMTRADKLRFHRACGLGYFSASAMGQRNHELTRRWRRELLDMLDQINRRVAKMARHDAKRAARLGIRLETTNRPLAGSTNSKSV